MNKKLTIGVLAVALILIGILVSSSKDEKKDSMMGIEESNSMIKEDVMMDKEGKDSMMKQDDAMKKDEMSKGETMMKSGTYEAYSVTKLSKAETGDVVLFFRASWCPTCRGLDKDIKENSSKIPEDLTILDVDYDNSGDLKKKYGVTYQHTLVQVDKDGNMIKKWQGSPTLSALVEQTS